MSDDLALRYEQEPSPDFHGVVTRYSVVLLSIGPEGEAYLDEHAPEWRQHIRGTRLDVSVFTPDEKLVVLPRETLVKLATRDAGMALGAKIAEQYAEIALSQERVDGCPG